MVSPGCAVSPPGLPAPDLHIPRSTSTVDVRVIDTNTRVYLKPGLFWEPVLRGFEGPDAPIYCFLVSHGDRHVVFDLGVRPDWENYAPSIVEVIKQSTRITGCDRDIASVIDDDFKNNGGHGKGPGIRSADVEAIVWSHSHFDHAGDPSRFPPSTALVVGPGVKSSAWPGYPTNPDAAVLDSDIAGREVREISFGGAGEGRLRLGRFDAFDYFGDGSFYLLDAPGHATGHMCGLARTTANPPAFVFMGADACHHPGVLRPSSYLPLPQPHSPPTTATTTNPATASGHAGDSHPHHGCCPGDLLEKIRKWKGPTADEPFFRVTRGQMFPDYAGAVETVAKMQELDAAGSMLVVIAHDNSLHGDLPLFPERVNGWEAHRLREATRWTFLKELKNVDPSCPEGKQ